MSRDFKLANIFVSPGPTVVIGDFGFAKSGSELANTILGTPLTMAPELLEKRKVYSSSTDLWSIGAVFYKLLFGEYPFRTTNAFWNLILEIMRAVARDKNMLLENIKYNNGENLKIRRSINSISKEAEDLLRRLLTYDPNKRIGWGEFFEHALFFPKKKSLRRESSLDMMMSQFSLDPVIGAHDVDEEFKKNQMDSKVAFKEELVDPLMMELAPPSPGKKHTIQKEEDILKQTDEEIRKMVENCYDFFEHERKQVEFIFVSIKLLRDLSKDIGSTSFSWISTLTSFILAKKGTLILMLSLGAIEKKNEFITFPGYNEFLASEIKVKSVKEYQADLELYENYIRHLSKQIEDQSTDPSAKETLLIAENPENTLQDYSQLLLQQLAKFKELVDGEDKIYEDPVLKTKCLYTLLNFGYAVESRKHFPFMVQNKQFDWEAFQSSLKALDGKELKARIRALNLFS